MKSSLSKAAGWVAAGACCFTPMGAHAAPVASAGLISTEQVVAAVAAPDAAVGRSRLAALLVRADLAEALAARGADPAALAGRVAALTDAQVAQLLAQVDSAPAGASGLIGGAVFLSAALLMTDAMGYTKVYPFVVRPGTP